VGGVGAVGVAGWAPADAGTRRIRVITQRIGARIGARGMMFLLVRCDRFLA